MNLKHGQGNKSIMADPSPGQMYFNTDALPQRDRFAVFSEEIVRRFTGLDLDTDDQSRFHASIEGWRAGSIGVCHTSHSVLNTARTPKHVRDGNDGLCLMLLERGAAYYHAERDGSLTLGPGDVTLCDYAYPGSYDFAGDSKAWSIKIPRSAIASLVPKAPWLSGPLLGGNPVAKKLLFGYLHAARSIDLSGSDEVRSHFGEHIVDLIGLAMGAEGDAGQQAEERGARSARRVAILREIERRSGEQDLSAAAIALRLGVTPRYVHLLLEDTGKNFTHHVLDKRLEKAAALLRQPCARDRTIADIALESGFNDLSYFGRAFRRRYEATPSDVREAAFRAEDEFETD